MNQKEEPGQTESTGDKEGGAAVEENVHGMTPSRRTPETREDPELTFQKRLRFGKNQLNIADAFYKEQGEPKQILKYAKEALAIFNELSSARPDESEILSLQRKADKIVIMCTYSPSQLEELLTTAKDRFAMGLVEGRQGRELQARWYFEKCLESLRPLLVIWGVTPETREMVEKVGAVIEELDRSGGLKKRAGEETKLFGYLDRLCLIVDMPLMDTLNEDTLTELETMRNYFMGMKKDTGLSGFDRVFGELDSELYNIFAEKIRIAMDAIQSINLMDKTADFEKIDEVLRSIETLHIEDSRREFVLRHAREIKTRYLEKRRHMEIVKELLEKRSEILRGAVDDQPRAERLECLLHELYDEQETPGYEATNMDMIERIAGMLHGAEEECAAGTTGENEVEEDITGDDEEMEGETSGQEPDDEKEDRAAVGEGRKEMEGAEVAEVAAERRADNEGGEERGFKGERVAGKDPNEESGGREEERGSEGAGDAVMPMTAESVPQDREGESEREEAKREETPEENEIERLMRIYRSLPQGETRDEVNRLLDSITADMIFDTTQYTPTGVSLGDDILEIIRDLEWQIGALRAQKAYFPFGTDGEGMKNDGGGRTRKVVRRVLKRVVKRPRSDEGKGPKEKAERSGPDEGVDRNREDR